MTARMSGRHRLLRTLAHHPHRYARYRAASQAITLIVLWGIPLSGLARFDAWGGEHLSLWRRVGAIEGLVAVLVAIAAFYLVTFLLNVVVGRLFCGWGCPLGQLHRLGDQVELAERTRSGRMRAQLGLALFATALSAGVALWWVSPRVLVEGSFVARAAVVAGIGLVAGLGALHGWAWRWAFCRGWCPIGLYYSVVTLERSHGVVFDERPAACKDCRACTIVCPVDIDPRRLEDRVEDLGGVAFVGLPALNHCLGCGDCVRACEHVFRREPEIVRVPLGFGVGVYGHALASGGICETTVERPDAEGDHQHPADSH